MTPPKLSAKYQVECQGKRFRLSCKNHQLKRLITVRNVVAEGLGFHRYLSFCSRGMGVYPSIQWGRHPPADTPWQTSPWRTPPPGRHPRTDTPPLGTHPSDRHCPQEDTPPPPNGHCSGRYASYWNAFFFVYNFTLVEKKTKCNIFYTMNTANFRVVTTF